MTTALATKQPDASAIEQVLVGGDLSRLNAEQRVSYYNRVCESLGLNPLTKPFAYLTLNGKTVLYALRDAAEQLRKLHGVSITDVQTQRVEDIYVVTVKAQDKTGRTDASTGAIALGTLKGENLANALMKAETKAKRRVTLSICGLGMLDETEVESIPRAVTVVPVPSQAEERGVNPQLQAAVADAIHGENPTPAPTPPDDSFADWWKAADEAADCGLTALQTVWKAAPREYQKFVHAHWPDEWAALKQRAVEVAK